MNEKYEVIITTISNSAKKKKKKITTISKEMYFSQTGECDKLEEKKRGNHRFVKRNLRDAK